MKLNSKYVEIIYIQNASGIIKPVGCSKQLG